MNIPSLDLAEIKASFRSRPERLGLEIEGGVVRFVRTEKYPDGSRKIATFGEVAVDPWHASELELQRLRAYIAHVGGDLKKVAVNMEHSTLRIRRMNLAKMPERDLIEAIKWNFREQVEVPIEKYVVGFTPLDMTVEGNKQALIAYGVSQEAVNSHVQLIKSLGVKLVSLEPAATALLAVFDAGGVLEDGKYHVCIASGEDASYFLVLKGMMVLFSRPMTGIGMGGLVKYVMRNLNLEEKEARDALASWMKAPRGEIPQKADETSIISDDALVKRVDAGVKIFFSKLVVEVQRSIDAFSIMYGVEGVDVVHLCGSGVFLPGLVDHLKKTLGIDTNIFNPFAKLLGTTEERPPETMDKGPLYAVAAGLAIP